MSILISLGILLGTTHVQCTVQYIAHATRTDQQAEELGLINPQYKLCSGLFSYHY